MKMMMGDGDEKKNESSWKKLNKNKLCRSQAGETKEKNIGMYEFLTADSSSKCYQIIINTTIFFSLLFDKSFVLTLFFCLD